mgnify:CR=1 FL=1
MSKHRVRTNSKFVNIFVLLIVITIKTIEKTKEKWYNESSIRWKEKSYGKQNQDF